MRIAQAAVIERRGSNLAANSNQTMCQCWQVGLHNVPVMTLRLARFGASMSWQGRCIEEGVSYLRFYALRPRSAGRRSHVGSHDKVVGLPSDLAERAARNLAASGLQVLRSAVRTTHALALMLDHRP